MDMDVTNMANTGRQTWERKLSTILNDPDNFALCERTEQSGHQSLAASDKNQGNWCHTTTTSTPGHPASSDAQNLGHLVQQIHADSLERNESVKSMNQLFHETRKEARASTRLVQNLYEKVNETVASCRALQENRDDDHAALLRLQADMHAMERWKRSASSNIHNARVRTDELESLCDNLNQRLQDIPANQSPHASHAKDELRALVAHMLESTHTELSAHLRDQNMRISRAEADAAFAKTFIRDLPRQHFVATPASIDTDPAHQGGDLRGWLRDRVEVVEARLCERIHSTMIPSEVLRRLEAVENALTTPRPEQEQPKSLDETQVKILLESVRADILKNCVAQAEQHFQSRLDTLHKTIAEQAETIKELRGDMNFAKQEQQQQQEKTLATQAETAANVESRLQARIKTLQDSLQASMDRARPDSRVEQLMADVAKLMTDQKHLGEHGDHDGSAIIMNTKTKDILKAKEESYENDDEEDDEGDPSEEEEVSDEDDEEDDDEEDEEEEGDEEEDEDEDEEEEEEEGEEVSDDANSSDNDFDDEDGPIMESKKEPPVQAVPSRPNQEKQWMAPKTLPKPPSGTVPCQYCKRILPGKNTAALHEKVCDKRPGQCKSCAKSMPVATLRVHEKNCQGTPAPSTSANIAQATTTCEHCDEPVASGKFDEHLKVCDWLPSKCQHCSMVIIQRDVPKHEARCSKNASRATSRATSALAQLSAPAGSHFESWTSDQVLTWLRGIHGLAPSSIAAFKELNVDGAMLVEITAQDLRTTLKINSALDRKQLSLALDKLKAKHQEAREGASQVVNQLLGLGD
ncbi:TRAF-type zinc finger domain-containing protein 1 [Hondaea fermentalgiana]|uniref:TRAF-type zinc finger domain-containing protein 1 n=1 Tax=Hondaea fermentalgiana TaxID=2315210 RepID=A0A2R5GRQ2_9STRA|nr:TRAF-type zinc finger domain-containing protein 1 [Hondaea fermentalgiana]|eukprot:GBG31021.1 TRAF-type zinc finger domain-containing protein 1 [Hondaea fermentalgiana]